MAVTLGLVLGALAGAGPSSPAARAATSLPCDIYATGGAPCTAAYSTIRALYASLYQIQRSFDSTYLNVGLLSAGGYANAAPQVSFCANTTCPVTKLYDQTSNHNDMPISPGATGQGQE